MQVAFYKGPATKLVHKLTHAVTCLRTGSKYSHCELVFSNMAIEGKAFCASSSGRDGGVRTKYIDLASGHWDLVNVNTYLDEAAQAERESIALRWFLERQGWSYDYAGLLFFVIPARLEHRKKAFCSEAVAAALGLEEAWTYSPEKLYQHLLNVASYACQPSPLVPLSRNAA